MSRWEMVLSSSGCVQPLGAHRRHDGVKSERRHLSAMNPPRAGAGAGQGAVRAAPGGDKAGAPYPCSKTI
jgi:hypothetical protein